MRAARLAGVPPPTPQAGAPPSSEAVRLLDVGACGGLFDGAPGIDATALDLHPGSDRTLQCDFLGLQVG
ncbi:MAG: hypothetical protein VXW00_16215, partial [Candidatus Latescibacterota bacterium]|nr:hypothetical protein [Candidatus Latescibacterota bacterium]